MHTDSRDLSLIIDADHPIAQDVIMRTRETGNFTYADLNQILAGYERLSAASEYAITGVNKSLGLTLRIMENCLESLLGR